jgi:L-alanine-DL-glutamate epimerase-like enolase superfamily enzyme
MKVTPASWAIPPWRDAGSTWTSRDGLLVTIEVDGATGTGEASPLPGLSRDDVATCRRALTTPPARTDAEPAALAAALAAAYPPAAAWALFTAILDARARARGIPLAALLAARPAATLPVAVVVDGVATALVAVARGVRTLKVKIGGSVPEAVARVATIREAVGPGVAIRVDGNRSFPPASVPALLDRLAPLDIELVEEPADGFPLGRTTPPLALDESLADPANDPAIDRAAVAAVVLKPTVLGPARTLAVAARARAAGVAVVVSHALEGAIGHAAACELALALAGTSIGSLAAGLGAHAGLDAARIPTLGPCSLEHLPRLGHGVSP